MTTESIREYTRDHAPYILAPVALTGIGAGTYAFHRAGKLVEDGFESYLDSMYKIVHEVEEEFGGSKMREEVKELKAGRNPRLVSKDEIAALATRLQEKFQRITAPAKVFEVNPNFNYSHFYRIPDLVHSYLHGSPLYHSGGLTINHDEIFPKLIRATMISVEKPIWADKYLCFIPFWLRENPARVEAIREWRRLGAVAMVAGVAAACLSAVDWN